MQKSKRHSVPPDYETSIFFKHCLNCSTPIFFGYKTKKVECTKCGAKVRIVCRGKKFEFFYAINTDNIVIKCNNPTCGKVFVLEKLEEQLADCPYCEKKYYIKLHNPELYIKTISK